MHSLMIRIIDMLLSYLIFGDSLVARSSFPSPLFELTASTGISPRSALDGIGGGKDDGGFLAGLVGWALEEAIE